jgi:hypothetical protein
MLHGGMLEQSPRRCLGEGAGGPAGGMCDGGHLACAAAARQDRAMLRGLILLVVLAVLGVGGLRLFGQASAPGPAASRPAAAAPPAPAAEGLSSPFGDALFRWRCITGLRDALGARPDWPLRRLARFCLCAADHLRDRGPRDLVVGGGDLAEALSVAEARYCRVG